MNGYVDEQMRALVPIQVGPTKGDETREVVAWVDTAFNGSLVIPKSKIVELGLSAESTAEAILADGNKVALETYGCCVEWFGRTYDTQVVPNDGEFALLGTMLLSGHRVEIDYVKGTVSIL